MQKLYKSNLDFFKLIMGKLKNIGLAALLSLKILGCGPLVPEGQKVQGYADGVITEQEAPAIQFQFESDIDGFNPVIKNLVNDEDIFHKKEFSRRGFKLRGITSKLHIDMPEDIDALARKHRQVCMSKMPDDVGAFYGPNKTIYMPKTYGSLLGSEMQTISPDLQMFHDVFFHELGHHLRFGLDEYGSKAHESYAGLKLYMLNRKLGMQTMTDALCFLPKKHADYYFDKYDFGCVNFIVQSNRFDGNLEAGLDYILAAPKAPMESYLREVLGNYPSISDAYLLEFEKALYSDGFRDSFDRLDNLEFDEMRDFLRAYAYYTTAKWNKIEGSESPRLFDKAMKYSENFLATYENPYFRGILISWLTGFYHDSNAPIVEDIKKMMAEKSTEHFKELLRQNYDNNKKIIELNKDYPCEYEFSSCTKAFSLPRSVHVQAYYDIVRFNSLYRSLGVDADELINLGLDFVDKFYPDSNFNYEDNPFFLAFMGNYVNFYTGYLLKDRLPRINESEKYFQTCSLAKTFFEYVKQGSCAFVESIPKKEQCEKAFGVDPYSLAQEQIDQLGDCLK